MNINLPIRFVTVVPKRWYSMDFSHEKPAPHQLEHVQTRLTETVPLMFRQRLDYTFYRKDVVCENQILRVEKRGLDQLRSHLGMIGSMGQLLIPHIEMELIGVHPVIEQGTVQCRWRIKYVSFPRLLLNPRLLRFDYRINNLSWFDGYSVFSVDGNGDVYKLTIQKMIKDDTKTLLKSPSDKLKEKLVNI